VIFPKGHTEIFMNEFFNPNDELCRLPSCTFSFRPYIVVIGPFSVGYFRVSISG
jgi:hypothetical protein